MTHLRCTKEHLQHVRIACMAIRARNGSMAGKFGFDNAVEMAAEAVEFVANPKARDRTFGN